MEIFRTPVPVPVSGKQIHYGSKIMFMGSCFSEYMGDKLSEAKFSIDNNPFGIVYNPFSINRGLTRLIGNEPYKNSELFQQDGVWASFDHHSRFSGIDKGHVLHSINRRLEAAVGFLKKTDVLFLTFGTSYCYELKRNGQVVSNCHKLPANEFNRRRISIDEIVAAYQGGMEELFRYNPNVYVVFTVSPVRHWKDGAHENQLSKAILLLAIDKICKTHTQALYFPSYELMMDELRDYRFYEEDMLHPNASAINFIWQKVKESFMNSETILLMKEIEKVVQASRHIPFHPKADSFQTFASQFVEKIKVLKEKHNIHLDEEDRYFRSLLM